MHYADNVCVIQEANRASVDEPSITFKAKFLDVSMIEIDGLHIAGTNASNNQMHLIEVGYGFADVGVTVW
ncbi:hypothetical protein SGRIM119S_06205 [Streptomyces griseorubiginosus]